MLNTLLMACLAAFFATASAQAAVFYPETFTLANGLQVIVVENRLSPAVSQMVWYKTGSADEAPGHSGLAHYLEHLMFRGTESVPAGMFSRLIAAQGGTDNAFTSRDYTAYHQKVAADRLGMIMQMEADRMSNLVITPETASTELNVVLSERQERTGNNPRGLFAEKVRQALFPNHPYGIPVIGWKEELEKITPDAAREFYSHHYAPNNAVVVISGNVDLNEVMRLAAGTYGRLPSRAVPARASFPPLSRPPEQRVVMTDARVKQPHLELHVASPSYATGEKNEAYALEVLSEALSGSDVGVLYRRLVMKRQIASAFDTSYDPMARGPSDFVFIAAPKPGQSIKKLERALHEETAALAQRGLTAPEVAQAKGRLQREALFARDSLMAPGYALGEALATDGAINDVESWPEKIGAVTTAGVNAALRRLVKSPYRVTGMLLPGPGPGASQSENAAAQPVSPGEGEREQ